MQLILFIKRIAQVHYFPLQLLLLNLQSIVVGLHLFFLCRILVALYDSEQHFVGFGLISLQVLDVHAITLEESVNFLLVFGVYLKVGSVVKLQQLVLTTFGDELVQNHSQVRRVLVR